MDFQAEQILPVVIISGVIYLVKIGAFGAVFLALRKLWNTLRKKDSE